MDDLFSILGLGLRDIEVFGDLLYLAVEMGPETSGMEAGLITCSRIP